MVAEVHIPTGEIRLNSASKEDLDCLVATSRPISGQQLRELSLDDILSYENWYLRSIRNAKGLATHVNYATSSF